MTTAPIAVTASTDRVLAEAATFRGPRRLPRTIGFVAMSVALLAFFVAAGAPTPLLPIYEREWGFSPSILTIAFGVYAFALIVSLLIAGSLSDHVGRRPVLIGALAIELVAMMVFLIAPSIAWVIVARVLQGLATGVASSTFSAAIVELAPERRKRLGAVMSSLATTAGLGVGALFSGVVALAVPDAAATTVWLALVVVMTIGTVFAVVTPETSSRRAGAAASLIPRVSVPANVRRLFVASVPTIVAMFLVTALFLGLVPTILTSVFHVSTPLVGGLINFIMFGTATLASFLASGVRPHLLKLFGNIAMAAAALILLSAIATGLVAGMWLAAVIAGAGMGGAFSGTVRGLVPEVEPHRRAGLFSAIFVTSYLVFGGSAIVAGFLAEIVGERPMSVGFLSITGFVALIGIASTGGVIVRDRRMAAPRDREAAPAQL